MAEMEKAKKPRAPQSAQGIALLEQIYFSQGATAAASFFRSQLPDELRNDYNLIKSGQGARSYRTDVQEGDGISYANYSPPTAWEPRYSLQRVSFEHILKQDFMFHAGEEILVPIRGEIQYHFYWSPGGEPATRKLLENPVKVGTIIRTNPQIPHHTWAASRDAEAWMVFRYFSDSPAALILDYTHPASGRRVTLDELQNQPGQFGVIAWGLAEKIRIHRQRANLSTTELAREIGADASHVSRIENGAANPSLETLVRIARVLRIAISDLVESSTWNYEMSSLPKASSSSQAWQPALTKPPCNEHFLHPYLCNLPQNAHRKFFAGEESDIHLSMSSWIMLRGRALLDLPEWLGGISEVLEEGSVIHFKKRTPVMLHALTPISMLQITYSEKCGCKPKE